MISSRERTMTKSRIRVAALIAAVACAGLAAWCFISGEATAPRTWSIRSPLVSGPLSPMMQERRGEYMKLPTYQPVDPADATQLLPTTSENRTVFSVGWRFGAHFILDFVSGCWGQSDPLERLRESLPEDLLNPKHQDGTSMGLTTVVPVRFNKGIMREGCSWVNPEVWTVVDMQGKASHVRFPYQAILGMVGGSSGWQIGSASLPPTGLPPVGPSFADEDLVFGIAAKLDTPPVLRRPLERADREHACEHNKVFDPRPNAFAPPPALLKQAMAIIEADHRYKTATEAHGILCWHAVNAVLAKGSQPVTLWLANVGSPNMLEDPGYSVSTKNYFFAEDPRGSLSLLQVRGGNGTSNGNDFHARFLAAVDLDGDGVDEILLQANYYESTNILAYRSLNRTLSLIASFQHFGV